MKNTKIIILILLVLLINGCNTNIDEQSSVDSEDIGQLHIQINELNDELERKSSEIDVLNKRMVEINDDLSTQEAEYMKLEEMNKSLQVLRDGYIDLFGKRINKDSIYNLSYSPKLIEFKEVQGTDVNQYIIPYEESESINILRNTDLVEVLVYVNNSDNESWALVIDTFARGIGAPSMGYVKADNLKDIDENPTNIPEHKLQEISVGDSIEDIISLLGRNYELVHDDYYTAIVYDDLFIYLDRYGYYANSVYMNLSEKNEFTFDGKGYKADNPEMFISDLEIFFERYYGNEKIASDANMKIDFMEFSISEDYTILIKFDKDSNIEGVSINSYGWLY